MADQKFPERVKNPSDDYSLMLTADQNKNTKKRPNLSMFMSLNGVKIKTYCADDEDYKTASKFYVGLSYVEGMMILHLIDEAIKSPDECTFKYEISEFTFFQGKRSDQPKALWNIVVGKDAEGLIYISVLSTDNGKPKIPYYFGDRYLRKLQRTRGGELTPAAISQYYAKAWVDAERAVLPLALVQQWPAHLDNEIRKKAEKDAKNGGGNRGGNGGGNSQQSSSKYQADDDGDDLPF